MAQESGCDEPERLWGELPNRLWWLLPLFTVTAATYQLVTWTSAGRWGPPELGVPILYGVSVLAVVGRWRRRRARDADAKHDGDA